MHVVEDEQHRLAPGRLAEQEDDQLVERGDPGFAFHRAGDVGVGETERQDRVQQRGARGQRRTEPGEQALADGGPGGATPAADLREHVAPGVVGHGALDRVARAGEDPDAERRRRGDQVGEEMGLADAGLALEPHQAAGALAERRQVGLQRATARRRGRRAGGRRPRRTDVARPRGRYTATGSG